tara:strand:+ start:2121 stop:2690 length:570 start_codon:yes stop_codon:yes gene_type:complete
MRQTIIIISILFSNQCLGQKWHLNNVDKSEKYPFEYWLQFENLEDTCSYELNENPESQNSIFRLFDNHGDTIIFAYFKLINLESESDTMAISELNGETELELKNGKYRIEIRAVKYDNFNLDFEIKNSRQVELKIKLGLAPELEIYQIDSKKELTESDILEIIECVRVNRNDFHKSCSDLKKYLIMMQI